MTADVRTPCACVETGDMAPPARPAAMAEVVTVVVVVTEAEVVVVSEGVGVAGNEMVTHCRRRGGSLPCWMSLMPCCRRLMWPTWKIRS